MFFLMSSLTSPSFSYSAATSPEKSWRRSSFMTWGIFADLFDGNRCEWLWAWQRTRGDIRIFQAHGPFDGFYDHLLKFRLVPVRFHVTQRRVINASFAIHLRPSPREIAVGAVNILVLHIELAHIEPHQHANFVSRIIGHLINLIPEHKRWREVLHAGKARVFYDDRCIEGQPRMFVVVAADHVTIVGPVHKSNGGAMDSDESLAIVMDERNEVGLLLSVHFKVSPGVEKYGVEIVQVLCVVFQLLLSESLGVGAQGRFPESSLTSQALDRSHCVGNRLVPVTLFFPDDQEMLFRRRHWRLRGAQTTEGHAQYQRSDPNRHYVLPSLLELIKA